jgi:uncharacterized Rmd1/YagE family protein
MLQPGRHPSRPSRTTKTSQKLVIFEDPFAPQIAPFTPFPPTEESSHGRLMNSSNFNSNYNSNASRSSLSRTTTTSRVTGFCTAHEYRIDLLSSYLARTSIEVRRFDGVMYARLCRNPPERQEEAEFQEAFFMDFGVVVFWGMEKRDEKLWLKGLRPFQVGDKQVYMYIYIY